MDYENSILFEELLTEQNGATLAHNVYNVFVKQGQLNKFDSENQIKQGKLFSKIKQIKEKRALQDEDGIDEKNEETYIRNVLNTFYQLAPQYKGKKDFSNDLKLLAKGFYAMMQRLKLVAAPEQSQDKAATASVKTIFNY